MAFMATFFAFIAGAMMSEERERTVGIECSLSPDQLHQLRHSMMITTEHRFGMVLHYQTS
jgi:hypothetical protein